jgi:DNA-binding NarL/FixJ family response regulator
MFMVRLLVAEDHTGMRHKVVSTLENEFSVVGSVADGQQMLDAESRVNPDVVILDISMPIMDGFEAATQLKQRAPNARIIFLTAHDDPAYLKKALAIGALGFVIKSRLASDLRLAVREVMTGRRFISPSPKLAPCEDGCGDECE